MPAVSKKQQKAMGIAHAVQQGEMKAKPGSPSAEIAQTMKPTDVREFAATPRKGLPKKAPKKKGLKMINVGEPIKKMKF
jgi:hypothetical protein